MLAQQKLNLKSKIDEGTAKEQGLITLSHTLDTLTKIQGGLGHGSIRAHQRVGFTEVSNQDDWVIVIKNL